MAEENRATYGRPWERKELVLALYLYCQIPFAKTKANNPEVIRLSSVLGRTPSSVARKLGNFGAFDPVLQEQGISGLRHYGREDYAVWQEFQGNWEALVEESQSILHDTGAEWRPNHKGEPEPIIVRPSGPSERQASVTVRLCQSFFRRTVLSSYNSACCICGIDLEDLLVAGHIVPWSVNLGARSDPENGLCLCSLHHQAFDTGLLSVDGSMCIVISSVLKSSRSDFLHFAVGSFADRKILLPGRFSPKVDYLQWHYNNVLQP